MKNLLEQNWDMQWEEDEFEYRQRLKGMISDREQVIIDLTKALSQTAKVIRNYAESGLIENFDQSYSISMSDMEDTIEEVLTKYGLEKIK